MVRIPAGKARDRLSDALDRVSDSGERIVIQRRGRDVAALVSVDDLALLQRIEDLIDIEDARAALLEAEGAGTVSWEKIKADLGL